MPVFEYVSRYPASRERVFAWHRRPGAFVRLTPPGMATVLRGPSDGVEVGSETLLRISHPLAQALGPNVGRRGRSGPLGVDWLVRHVELTDGERFADEQVRGPFSRWRHEHHFADGPGGSTVITDRVEWALPGPESITTPLVEMILAGLFGFRERQLRGDLAAQSVMGSRAGTVLVAGSSGLVGTQLCAYLSVSGHRVVRLVRKATGTKPNPDAVRWDPSSGRLPRGALDGVDAVVNLAGHTIGGRFTQRNKRLILASRVDATTTLAKALAADPGERVLVQASAIGIYGARRPGEILTEDSRPGTGFLADVVRAWEAAATPASDAGVRTAYLRTGIVLSEAGGALSRQLPLFAVGLGGRLTDADAWLSWIGLDDLVRGYGHAVASDELEGPVNACAPRPVTHQEFAETLGHVMHRPSWLPTPSVGPTLLLGREGYDQLVHTDQRVSARLLTDSGFRFGHGNLGDALHHALMR